MKKYQCVALSRETSQGIIHPLPFEIKLICRGLFHINTRTSSKNMNTANIIIALAIKMYLFQ